MTNETLGNFAKPSGMDTVTPDPSKPVAQPEPMNEGATLATVVVVIGLLWWLSK